MKKYLLSLLLLYFHTGFAHPQFQSLEHKTAGDQILLQFDTGISRPTLTLDNGLKLSYGEIILLAGDFYGIPESPIALGNTLEEKRSRFLLAFETLNTDPKAVDEVPHLLAIADDLNSRLQTRIKQGENLADAYTQLEPDYDIAWNCATGGLCTNDVPWLDHDSFQKIFYLKPGRYLNLLLHNFDHFGLDAINAYTIGHQLALETAIAAHQQHQITLLIKAYAMNAFANHYLSDIFSSGHMRTPHYSLYNTSKPALVGSLLAGLMHNEDNQYGLIVSNARGNTWRAYGDSYYLDERNQTNQNLLRSAMQASADAIYTSYVTGKLPNTDFTLSFTPDLEKLKYTNHDKQNTAALFYWDDNTQSVWLRSDKQNPYSYQWTNQWLGWETLYELSRTKIKPIEQKELLLDINKAMQNPKYQNEVMNRRLAAMHDALPPAKP